MLEDSECKFVSGGAAPKKSLFKPEETMRVRTSAQCDARQIRNFLTDRRESTTPAIMLPMVMLRDPSNPSPLNLQNFRLRWALKKMARKLHGLSVPKADRSGEVREEWMNCSTCHVEEEVESKGLIRQSDWPNRIFQPFIVLTYLLACWYVSVDMVFSLTQPSSLVILAAVILLADITLSLNTVRLKDGRSLRTRYSILM